VHLFQSYYPDEEQGRGTSDFAAAVLERSEVISNRFISFAKKWPTFFRLSVIFAVAQFFT